MQIPLTLPEQTTPLPTRRDIQALSPVSPVPGVEGLAETLDPRLALQWTQPVLGDQSADLTRSVLEQVALAAPAPTAGDASRPAASASAVAWSSLAQVLAPLLQRIEQADPTSSVRWPAESPHPPAADASASNDLSGPLMQAMQSLRTQLAQSDVFAAHHLIRQWFKPPETSSQPAETPVGEASTAESISRWVSALSPESATAEDITRMLLNGKMQWQGQLLPGIAVTLDREDAWREDPQHPGQAQKGAALRAQIDLPRAGRMTVIAHQWGAHIDLRVMLPATADAALTSAWPQLQQQLAQLNLPDLHLTREETS
jgi:hypothetical protein